MGQKDVDKGSKQTKMAQRRPKGVEMDQKRPKRDVKGSKSF